MSRREVRVPFDGFYESHADRFLEDIAEHTLTDAYGCALVDGWMRDKYGRGRAKLYDRAFHLFNWAGAQKEFLKQHVASVSTELGLELKFERKSSPREYNFHTDVCYATISSEDADTLLDKTPEKFIAAKAKAWFTPRSGFIPFYRADWRSWGPFDEWDHNQLGCLLEAQLNARGNDMEFWFENYDVTICRDSIEGALLDMKKRDAVVYERLRKINEYMNKREVRAWT